MSGRAAVAWRTAKPASRTAAGTASPRAAPSTIATMASIRPVTSSAAPATSAPSRRPGPVSRASTRRPASTVATPNGTLMKKTQRQPAASVIRPPRKRPIEAPEAPTNE